MSLWPPPIRYSISVILSVALIVAAYEAIDASGIFGLADWQTHVLGIAFCILSVGFIAATLLKHERASSLKLRDERDLSTALINSLPAAVALFDSAGTVLKSNANFLGYTESEARKLAISDLVSAKQWPLMAELFQRTVTSEFVAAAEFELITRDGTHIPQELRDRAEAMAEEIRQPLGRNGWSDRPSP